MRLSKNMNFSIVLVTVLLCVYLTDDSHAAVLDRGMEFPNKNEGNETAGNIIKECGVDKLFTQPVLFIDRVAREKIIRDAKCKISCMLKKANLVTDNNKLNKEAVERIGLNNPDVLRAFSCTDDEFYDKCSHIKDTDECEYAYNVIGCFKSVCQKEN